MPDNEGSEVAQDYSGYNKDSDVVVYRTDTSNPEKWEELKELVLKNEFPPSYFYVDAPGIPIDELPLLTDESFIVLADEETMNTNAFVVIDRESGRRLRAQAEFLADVTNNLSIANMDFEEFEDSVKEDGVYRGFEDPVEQSAPE